MADKRISDLPAALSVQTNDLFVLEQSSTAKKLTGQILINDLAAALDGHGGISSITYTPPVGATLNGTLTINLADGTSYSLSVTNGRGISNIVWSTSGVSGDGQYHNGTIQYNDGTTSTVQFRDGVKGDRGYQTYVWFKWSANYPTSDADMSDSVNAYIGIYAGTSATKPTTYTSYTWYQYKGEKGDTGSNIQSITLTSTSGLVDTYTVTLTDGETSTFTVTNAKSIVSVTQISGSHAAGTTDVYQILFNDGDTAEFSVYNGANGLGSVSSVSGIQADGNGNVPQVISGNGAPTTATVGQENQLYYDLTNSVLYYCAGESEGTYVWLGAGVTVDSTLSGSSTNPVQNAVITNRIGTGALPNSNTNLTAAINYVDGRIPSASTTTPQKDGTGAAGTGTTWARSNHVHPLNVPDSGVPSALGTASQGSSTAYSRSDHVHPMPSAADVGAVSYTVILPNNTDLDTVLTSGFYRLSVTHPNSPTNANYSQMIVSRGGDTVSQSIYIFNAPIMWVRTGYGIGTGTETWSEWVNYVSSVSTVSLPLSWVDSGNGYYTVTPTVSGATITARSKVNLQPTAAQSIQLQSDGVTSLYVENNAGTLTAYAVGNAPSVALTMQCTVETTDSTTGAIGDTVGGGGGGGIDEGSNYFKFSSGTMIQWGTLSIPANTTWGRGTFSEAFISADYWVSATIVGTPAYAVSVGGRTVDHVDINRSTSSSYAQNVNWIVIGRWK